MKVRRGDLEKVRKRMGYTQLEIADRLGVHVRTWAKWISGERTCPWTVWLALQAIDMEHLKDRRRSPKPRRERSPKPARERKSRAGKKGA